MARPTLDEILSVDDDLGLLDVEPGSSTATTERNRIKQQFEAINGFIDSCGRLPGSTAHPSVSEKSLHLRLSSLQNNIVLTEQLAPYDRHGLFVRQELATTILSSLDDIFATDDEVLSTPSDDIFEFKHVRPAKARTDTISERQVCEDFDLFKPLFDECIKDIQTGKRQTRKFANEQEIGVGQFFILNGVLVYVAEVNDPHIRNGKRNARLRVIFDNGTEGRNLLRSLATELYKDPAGRRILDTNAGPLFSEQINDGDVLTGLIYVIKSLSDDPRIKDLDGTLYKIGFTSAKMETRIQNAKDDPTFLMAPVRPVKTYSLYNIDKVKLENLLHRFFADVRLDIEVIDRFGKPVKPREWFLLSIDVIDEAIARLKDGTIIDFRFDNRAGMIVSR